VYMQANTAAAQALDLTISGFSEWRGSWLDVFPGDALIESSKPDQMLVVDIAGGLISFTALFRSLIFTCALRLIKCDSADFCRDKDMIR
jgi:hypothetical protein